MRELIALAIAVTRGCDGCIAAHARGAANRGATAQEVAETLGVAISMNGGPVLQSRFVIQRLGDHGLPGAR